MATTRKGWLAAAAAAVLACGCGAEEADEDVGASEDRVETPDDPVDKSFSVIANQEVWIYGGENGDVELGCVNCYTSRDFVKNPLGPYGRRTGDSIWNPFSKYGSDVHQESPWNLYGSKAPKLYAKDKSAYYGIFTVNYGRVQRTRLVAALNILEGGRDGL